MNELKRHIHAKNEVSRILYAEANNVLPQLTPYIGKKILLQGGANFSARFKINYLKPEPKPIEGGNVMVRYLRLDTMGSMLILDTSVCFSGGSYDDRTYYCTYEKDFIVLGHLTPTGELESVENVQECPEPLVLENEIEAIKHYKTLLKAVNVARAKIRVQADYYKYLFD